MLSTPALWVAFAAMVPLMVLTAWLDLKYLKIPNWLVLCVLAVFLMAGLWGLPFDTFAWRLVYGGVTLVIGFGLFSLGLIGGGDAKMAAVLVPFAAPVDAAALLLIYAILTLALLIVLQTVMFLARRRETGWLAVDQMSKPRRERVFPMGLIFGAAILLYLGLETADTLSLL